MPQSAEPHRFVFGNLEGVQPGGGRERGSVGVTHVAYTYADPGALLETYERLKGAGILPYWSIHHGITLSNYYRDPDGNRMEFQADADLGFMDSPKFAENPIGVEVDMEELLARYRAGTSAEELLATPTGAMSAIPELHGLT